ncbi:hypothetical protein GQ607_006247 [Colletotrichum asianum]|uniref:Uncharacterized protein n=1 Tax=Colletotrichum asianum TaxID=702518 RepID=A0A8H3WGP9_9PEZI|nr:hypothetical protein GQ607_006247 [Colletotrichum asianum]
MELFHDSSISQEGGWLRKRLFPRWGSCRLTHETSGQDRKHEGFRLELSSDVRKWRLHARNLLGEVLDIDMGCLLHRLSEIRSGAFQEEPMTLRERFHTRTSKPSTSSDTAMVFPDLRLGDDANACKS